jgi:hypothetical protein
LPGCLTPLLAIRIRLAAKTSLRLSARKIKVLAKTKRLAAKRAKRPPKSNPYVLLKKPALLPAFLCF